MSHANPRTPVEFTNEEMLTDLRGYLAFLAEQHLDAELRAKGGSSDIVQTTLASAYQARHQFQGETPRQFRGWLRRILVNVVRSFRRHWVRQRRGVQLEVPLQTQIASPHHPVHSDTPSKAARCKEQNEAIVRALADLNEEQRQVIALRMNEGLSFIEIGEAIGRSPDAARMVYHRALDRLRALLPDTKE